MSNRHSDALAIQCGAVNPSGICHSIIEGCKEMRDWGAGTAEICNDPAIRLMVHQRAFLCRVAEIDQEFEVYSRLADACGSIVRSN
jgi:hypothetical protein